MATEKSITSREELTHDSCAKLKYLGGRFSGDEVPITKEVFFIGRSQNNNLVLEDRSVSRKHAVINFIEGAYTISDLNSFKGVKVNGKKVKESPLRSGDRLNIGSIVMEFIAPIGVPVVPHKKKKWFLLGILLIVASAVIVIYSLAKKSATVPTETLREIEYNYSQGVKAYNVDKDVDSARLYWQKVLALDPNAESEQAAKVKMLLKSIPSNSGGATGR